MTELFERVANIIISEGLAWKKDYFDWWEARGLHLTPVHFYSAIPEVIKLDSSLWSKYSDLPGVEGHFIPHG